MLDPLWLMPLFGVGVWAFWSGFKLLSLAVTLACLVSGSILFWRRFSLTGVTYRRRLAGNRANFGEYIGFEIEITNLKLLPLTWLMIEDTVPSGLPIEGGTVKDMGAIIWRSLLVVLAMLPYERVVRQMRIHCIRRGVFSFGPASLQSGDYLGVLSQYGSAKERDDLIVFPKMFRVIAGHIASNQIVGRNPIRRDIHVDPLRISGAREYLPGDPFRTVDWPSSARTGKLMVRLF